MRTFLSLFLGMSIWVEGAGIVTYVDDDGVKVLTNMTERHRPLVSQDTPEVSGNFLPLIEQVASRHGIDRELVQAIIKVESDFDPNAVSHKNCKGLMQLHPDTARRFGVRDIFDPAQNLEGGVKYLSFLIETFGDELDHVLAAYNAGENAVLRYEGIPPYPETIGYVEKVKAIFGDSLKTTTAAAGEIIRLELPDGHVLFTNERSGFSGLRSSTK